MGPTDGTSSAFLRGAGGSLGSSLRIDMILDLLAGAGDGLGGGLGGGAGVGMAGVEPTRAFSSKGDNAKGIRALAGDCRAD